MPKSHSPNPITATLANPLPRVASHAGATGRFRPSTGGQSAVDSWLAIAAVVLLGASFLAFALCKPDRFSGKSAAPVDLEQNFVAFPIPEAALGPAPRRLLAIGVGNYLYANPIQYGKSVGRDRRDFYTAVERLADGWRIPKSQRYFVANGAVEDGKIDYKHPPLKTVIEGTIDTFLKTSRAQDRIVIVFAGHAIEKAGEAYLVPVEGDLEDLNSLIPLKGIYAKLAKCPAQEKLVIFDVCRFCPSKVAMRPSFGMMTEALSKALHDCPDDAAVWTACSNVSGQYSYEDEEVEMAFSGLGKLRIEVSYFLSLLFPAYDRGVLGRRNNIVSPSDPLPLGPVSEFINEKTAQVALEFLKKPQTPRLTSKLRKKSIAYPTEPAPARFEITSPPPTAAREDVEGIFKELGLPSIKAMTKNDDNWQSAEGLPFTEAQLNDFVNAGPTFAEIVTGPAAFAKEFPLRVATVEVFVELRKLKNDGSDLPEEFRDPITADTKKAITNKYQRILTERMGILDELKDQLEAVAKKRTMEKSKRWLANFDYARAQVRARLAYIYEYNLALGQVKIDKLPELDPKRHKGWRLAAVPKMASPKEIRDLADEAKGAFAAIATNYPNTPWAVMARSHQSMAFGQKWEPK